MIWFYKSFFPAVWIAFLIYWQIKAANTKKTQRLEPAGSRILRVLTILARRSSGVRSQFGETYAKYVHRSAALVPYLF